ncbi:MAG: hypothetical protein SWK76_05965 [Actinomycetota bacterium]|nr:hypothetical protein [Actinomycetota bacterium]
MGKDVSIKIHMASEVIAERSIHFDYKHKGLSANGGNCARGDYIANNKSTNIFFAEGYTGEGYRTWLCLYNLGTEDALVEISYFTQEAGQLPVRTIAIPSRSRRTICVNDNAGEDLQVSSMLKVISGGGIVVERSVYFDCNSANGGHVEIKL